MSQKKCAVSFRDIDGILHSVEVEAETLYEAAAVAAHTFQEHGCGPGRSSEISIEVKAAPVVHTLTMGKVVRWLDEGPKSPKEIILKGRLKELLSVWLAG